MEELKLCVNCVYHSKKKHSRFVKEGHICNKKNSEIDVVTGDIYYLNFGYCHDRRKNEEECGKEGKWFE